MRILHINTWDDGGAAIACKRLNNALNKSGYSSQVLVLENRKNSKKVADFKSFFIKRKGIFLYKLYVQLNRILSFIPTIGKPKVYFNGTKSMFRIHEHPLVKEADIIHLHWVVKFLDYPSFFEATKNKKIIWTMHDMNPFAGGYHYITDLNFKAYQKLINKIENKKNLIFSQLSINAVSPSKWLGQIAGTSHSFKNVNVTVIPNCVSTNFNERKEVDEFKNIPKDKKKILFVAENIDDDRKGFKLLLEALSLVESDVFLIIIGNPKSLEIKSPHVFTGYINDEQLMSRYYKASDVFVISSIEDNLPNTVLESLACGTPVVGFNIGGMPDMIDHKLNGYLARPKDINDLATGINWCLESDKDFLEMNALTKIKTTFAEPVVVAQYVNLYKD